MATARLISCSLGTSRKFRELALSAKKLGEFAQALYPLLVVNSDDFGRQHGDAFTVKHKVFPVSPRSEGDFTRALECMHEVGLIILYSDGNGKLFLQISDFEQHQSGLHKRTKSKFPEPLGNSRKVQEIPSETNRRETNRRESKGRERAKRASPSPDDFPVTDALKEWASKHVPGLDVEAETEKFLDHHRSKGNVFRDWSAAWRKWMRNADQWNSRGRSQAGGHSIREELFSGVSMDPESVRERLWGKK